MTERIILHDFRTTKALCAAYMPYVEFGGLFIASKEVFVLGEAILLDISLLDEPERQKVRGNVVWITPRGAQGGKPAGAGIQFNEKDSVALRTRVETYLAGMLNSPLPTDTM